MIHAPILALPFARRVGGYDPAAAAYFTAAGITNAAQKAAYNAHVLRGRASGWYSLLAHEYPFIGAAFSAHKIDAINPGGTALTKMNTVTDSANGIQGDGSTGYMLTGWARNSLPQIQMSMALYCHTQPGSGFRYWLGLDNYPTDTQQTAIYQAPGTVGAANNSATGQAAESGPIKGAIIGTRSTTQDKILMTGQSSFTAATKNAPATNLSTQIPILALNRSNTIGFYTDGVMSYIAFLSAELALADAIAYRDSINQLQTDLGRATH